jgi:hypothetical protein
VSLYRRPGRVATRTVVIAAVAALAVGLVAGFALGRGTASEPSLADKLTDLRTELDPARQGIELTATEYAQAVRGGRVVEPTEYSAAQADVKRAQDAIDAARADLDALDPARAAALERAVDGLAAAVDRRAAPATVAALSARADAALTAAVGR